MASASDKAPNRRLEQLMRMTTLIGGCQVPPHGALLTAPANALQQYPAVISNPGASDDIPYPLTRDEAIAFLEDVLGIPDPERLIMRDREEFVNTFVHRMCTIVPFTNIPHRARPIDAKGGPTFEECKEAILRCQGGHCYYKNIFSKALLDVLGFTTYHVAGNNPGEDLFDTHAAIIMRDLTYLGSLHLIEPGTMRPIFRAIPLDFDRESPAYRFSFMTSKFFKQDHGRLLWCALVPEETGPSADVLESDGHSWKVQITYRLDNQKSRAFFSEMADCRFGIPGVMPSIHQVAIVVGYKGEHMYSIATQRNERGIRRLAGLKIDHEDSSECEVNLLAEEEVVNRIVEFFPQFPRDMVQRAVDNTEYGGNLFAL